MAAQKASHGVSPEASDALAKVEDAVAALVRAQNLVSDATQLLGRTNGDPPPATDNANPASAVGRESQIALARAEESLSALMKGLVTGDWEPATPRPFPQPPEANLEGTRLKKRIVVAEEPPSVQRGLLKLPGFLRGELSKAKEDTQPVDS